MMEHARLFDADVGLKILYNMIGLSLSSNSFFNYLEGIGRKLIGLYGVLGFVPGLAVTIVSDSAHCKRK